MGGRRDGYSNFRFFEVMSPQVFEPAAAATVTGAAVDTQGFETTTFIFAWGEASGVASANISMDFDSGFWVRMQHGDSNAANAVVWSACQPSEMLIDATLSGEWSGYLSGSYGLQFHSNEGSGPSAGTWLAFGIQTASISDAMSRCYAGGYIGARRWVRCVISVSAAGDLDGVTLAMYAVQGLEANWPVNFIKYETTTGRH